MPAVVRKALIVSTIVLPLVMLAVLWNTLGQPTPTKGTEFVIPPGQGMLPVELPATNTTLDRMVHRTIFEKRKLRKNRLAQRFGILLATYGQSIPETDLSLTLTGQTDICVIAELNNQTLEDNQVVYFEIDEACWQQVGNSVELAIHTPLNAKVAAWHAPTPHWAYPLLVSPTQEKFGPVTSWEVEWNGLPATPIDLYGYLWDTDRSVVEGRIKVAMGFVIAGASAIMLIFLFGAGTLSARFIAGLIASGTLLGFGISALFAVIAPPLQAPDEPDHLLSIGAMINSDDLRWDALRTSRRTHFDRLKFRPDQKFSLFDSKLLTVPGWDWHVRIENTEQRSPLAAAVWKTVANGIGTKSAADTIYLFRISHALFFALALGTVLLLLSLVTQVQASLCLAIAASLWPPALAFMAMHLSNHAINYSLYLINGALLLCYALRGPSWALVSGAALVTAALIFNGRTGLLVLPLWLGLLALSPLWTEKAKQEAIYKHMAFLAAYCVAAALAVSLTPSDIVAKAGAAAGKLGLPNPIHPISIALLPILGLPVVLLSRLPPWQRYRGHVTTASAALLLLVIAIGAIWGTFVHDGPLTDIEAQGHGYTALRYGRKVIQYVFYNGFFGHIDLYTSSSFWVSYGWLASQPAPPFVWFVRSVVFALFAAVIFTALRRTAEPSRHRTVGLGLALVVYLGIVAVAAYSAGYNVQGRYLTGFYLGFIALAFGGLAHAHNSKPWFGLIAPIFLSAALATNLYALIFLVQRYFPI